MLTTAETSLLRQIATILLPGDGASPPAGALPDLDELIGRAIAAIGPESAVLRAGLAALPEQLDWDALRKFARAHETQFEVISTVVAGAYFMSASVLDSIGYPHGPRRAVRNDLVVDELESGVLDPVLARDSMVRAIP